MYSRALLSLYISSLIPPIAGQSVIPLNGGPWVLTNPTKNISAPAAVPGSVHLDLQRAQVIGDPYYGKGYINIDTHLANLYSQA